MYYSFDFKKSACIFRPLQGNNVQNSNLNSCSVNNVRSNGSCPVSVTNTSCPVNSLRSNGSFNATAASVITSSNSSELNEALRPLEEMQRVTSDRLAKIQHTLDVMAHHQVNLTYSGCCRLTCSLDQEKSLSYKIGDSRF